MKSGRWAWVVWGSTTALAVVRPFISESAANQSDRLWEYVFATSAILAFATVGALITSRQPGNRIGLLLSGLAAAAAVGMVAGEYSTIAAERELPLLELSAWVSTVAFIAMLGPLAFLFLLFPTGQVSSPRWRWLLRLMLVAYGVAVTGFALTPGTIESGFVDVHDRISNPIAFPAAWREAVQAVTQIAGIAVFAGAVLSVVSLVLRFRRAGTEERQQIRWLAYLAGFLGIFMLALVGLAVTGVIPEDEDSVIGNVAFFVAVIGLFFGIPAACGVAILRYRLYELDVIIKKTVLYAVLVLLILAVTAVGGLVLGGLVIRPENPSPAALLVIGAIAGFVVWPLRGLAGRIADRLVYGGRASPYEALATFSHRVGDTYESEDVLPRMATILRETTRAGTATVWLRVGDTYRPVATSGTTPPPVRAIGDELPALPGDHVAAVRHQGELLGALGVEMPANDPIDRTRERLVEDLASQAGAVLRNVRLIEELRASRQRLVAAQDEERRKLERNLHDGAQQQLVALSVRARLAKTLVAQDPDKAAAQLDELQTGLTGALEELRDLARGIYPPLLADQGLAAALAAQARKAAVPTSVEAGGVGRHPRDVEAAVYFCTLEAMNNTAKYAEASLVTIRLVQANGQLSFEVADDGGGFDPATAPRGTGLQGMADRLAVLDGSIEVRSTPGAGTTVTGHVPAFALDVAR